MHDMCSIGFIYFLFLTTTIDIKVTWIHSHNHGLREHTNCEQPLY